MPDDDHLPHARPAVGLVGAGPGDPELFGVRAKELLHAADVAFVDARVHPATVALAAGDVLAFPGTDDALVGDVVARARAGARVVVVAHGDGWAEGGLTGVARALGEASVPFEVVPGVSTGVAAAAYAGIDATKAAAHRVASEHDLAKLVGGLPADASVLFVASPTLPAQRVLEARADDLAAALAEAGIPLHGVVLSSTADCAPLRWFDTRPLFGKRVLVTRPAAQIAKTARALRLRGAEPIAWPTIAIVAPPDQARVHEAVRALGTYDLVAFTSENGVDGFFRAIDALSLDARAFGAARLAAIGTGTAEALAAKGVRADVVPPEFVGEALAKAILDDLATRPVPGRAVRALVPRAEVAREVLPDLLRAAGVEVDVVPVYTTRPAAPERAAELRALFASRGVDVVLLTASSTADALADLLGTQAPALLRDVLVASIGPITTATAERRGLPVGVTAEVSTTAGLVAAVEAHLARSRAEAG